MAVAAQAKSFFQQAELFASHGQQTRDRYQSGGVDEETLLGLPGLFDIALPSIESYGDDFEAGAYLAMSRLMMNCEDTTTLHRGGQAGLARLRKAGEELEYCLLSGQSPQLLLKQMNADFRTLNLTMGGVADLLGLAFGYLNMTRLSQFGCQELQQSLIANY